MDFEQLERQVKKRKRGMITLENIYVVLLVAAWASVVLLAIILIIGIAVAFSLPPNFGKTIIEGYQFFDQVSTGWSKGVLEIKKQNVTTTTSNIEYMISELVQFIYGLDVSAIYQRCPPDNMLHSIDFLIDVPRFVEEAKDTVSFVVTQVERIPLVGCFLPLMMYFPTDRKLPPTIQLERHTRNGYSIETEGFYVHDNIIEFPRHQSLFINNTWKLHETYMLYDDDSECEMYKIKQSLNGLGYNIIKPIVQTQYKSNNLDLEDHQQFKGIIDVPDALRFGITINNELPDRHRLQTIHLSFKSVRFYDDIKIGNKTKCMKNELNLINDPSQFPYFKNNRFVIKFDNSESRWLLSKNIQESYVYDRFRDIFPLKLRSEIIPRLPHNKINETTINIIKVTTNQAEFNGEYKLLEKNSIKDSIQMKILYHGQISADDGSIIYIRERIDSSTQFTIQYQLVHEMFDGVVHKWTLKKYIITPIYHNNGTCFESIASKSLQFKPINTPQQIDFFKLQTKSQFAFHNSSYIISVAIEYVLNDVLWYASTRSENLDKNIYRTYICSSQIHFKSGLMYLKMQKNMGVVEYIPIKLSTVNINKLDCITYKFKIYQGAYLLMDNIIIESDMFQGRTKGKVHIRFPNEYICTQFVNTVKMHYNIGVHVHQDMSLRYMITRFCALLKTDAPNIIGDQVLIDILGDKEIFKHQSAKQICSTILQEGWIQRQAKKKVSQMRDRVVSYGNNIKTMFGL